MWRSHFSRAEWEHRLVVRAASSTLLFTAQPKAPAIAKAGASGWAVNE
jgi:hypothetical protein